MFKKIMAFALVGLIYTLGVAHAYAGPKEEKGASFAHKVKEGITEVVPTSLPKNN